MVRKNRVSYFYDPEIGNYYYAPGHPMKPHRIRMAHNLILNYHVYESLDVYRPLPASKREMTKFHSDDYIDFLETVTPQTLRSFKQEIKNYNLNEDSPVFDGLFDFSQKSVGGTLGGAVKLNQGHADVAINWAGGLHHAKKSSASGFCYVNDIVLGILELLKVHYRVLYVDIDIHHGDGVEEAFYTTDRVMTASFHKYGDYFPYTGGLNDCGVATGKYHAVNFPLQDGIDDASYANVFQPVMAKIMETFQPGAILMQCGTDSLVGDRLGTFNLTLRGHGKCVEFMNSFGVPLLLVGGGGYTIRNVSRCWAYETAMMAGRQLPNELPFNDYYEYFGPEHKLHIHPSNRKNLNEPKDLATIQNQIFENLRHVSPPSIQISGAAAAGPRDPAFQDDDFADGEQSEDEHQEDDADNRMDTQDEPRDLYSLKGEACGVQLQETRTCEETKTADGEDRLGQELSVGKLEASAMGDVCMAGWPHGGPEEVLQSDSDLKDFLTTQAKCEPEIQQDHERGGGEPLAGASGPGVSLMDLDESQKCSRDGDVVRLAGYFEADPPF